MTLYRIPLSFVNALFITACLLYVMYSLIRIDEPALVRVKPPIPIAWTHVPDDSEVQWKIPKPKLPDPVEPVPTVLVAPPVVDIDGSVTTFTGEYQPPKHGGLPRIYNSQLVLALGVPPVYPGPAIQKRIEGYVIVGFSVNAAGGVVDPVVIESSPPGVFDKSAIKAIRRFKYKARMVDGKAVATTGQQYMFSFKLED